MSLPGGSSENLPSLLGAAPGIPIFSMVFNTKTGKIPTASSSLVFFTNTQICVSPASQIIKCRGKSSSDEPLLL